MLTKRINKRRYSRVRLPGCPAASSAPPRRDFSPIDRAAEPTMLSFAIESTYLCRGIARTLCTSSTTRAVFYGLTLSDKVYLVIFSVSFRDRLPVIRARWGSPWKEKLFNDQFKVITQPDVRWISTHLLSVSDDKLAIPDSCRRKSVRLGKTLRWFPSEIKGALSWCLQRHLNRPLLSLSENDLLANKSRCNSKKNISFINFNERIRYT